MPRHINVMLGLYLGVVVFAFMRMYGDTEIVEYYYDGGTAYMINEFLVNNIKWVIPALLLYDGCRTEERYRLATLSILAVYFLLAVQVAKWMPPQLALDSDALERRSLRVLVSGMGFHRVNLSAMLAGASWAVLCTRALMPFGKRFVITAIAIFIVYAQMMTGGRAGYGAFLAVGIALSILKWRRYLIMLPVAGLLAVTFAPGVIGRATEGFTAESHDSNRRLEEQATRVVTSNSQVDAYTVTAGRSVAWPMIIAKIKENPVTGYGRQAMLRTGIATYLYDNFGEIFPHPHNAYLEQLLDNGLIGFSIIIPFYALMLFYSIRLFLDKKSPTCSAAGGVAAALIMGLLVSAMGSQTFYPREGWIGMWCAMMLMLRVRTERLRVKAAATATTTGSVAAADTPSASPAPHLPPARPGVGPLWPAHAAPTPAVARTSNPAPAPTVRQTERKGGQAPMRAIGPLWQGASPTAGRQVKTGAVVAASPAQVVPAAAPTSAQSRTLGRQRPVVTSEISRLGWFGPPVVSDPLVWERA
jgi:O-antigen ligase